jgi:hypothetical protein
MRDSSAALPLPHYVRLTFGELTERIQSLTAHELHQLLGYEWVHLRRDEVIELLSARLKELGTGVAPASTPVVLIPQQATSPENLPVMPPLSRAEPPRRDQDQQAEGTERPRPTL